MRTALLTLATAAAAAAAPPSLEAAASPIWHPDGPAVQFAVFHAPPFVLPAGATAATLLVTARQSRHKLTGNGNFDSKLLGAYKLTANGALVTAGPGRNVPLAPTVAGGPIQAVDAVDLLPFLPADGSSPSTLALTCFWANGTGFTGETPRLWAVVNVTTAGGATQLLAPTGAGAGWTVAAADAYYAPSGNQDAGGGNWYQLPAEDLVLAAAPTAFLPATPAPPFEDPLQLKDARPPTAYYRVPCSLRCVAPAPGGGACANFVADFGQQVMGGWALALPPAASAAAAVVVVKQGEQLNPDGTVAVPSRSGVNYTSTVTLLPPGSGTSPTLAQQHEFRQFRWVEVSGWPTPSGLPGDPADVAVWAVAYPVAGVAPVPAPGGGERSVLAPVVGTPWDLTCGANATALAGAGHPLAAAGRPWQLAPPAPGAYAHMGDLATSSPAIDAVWALTARSMTATALDVNVDSQTRQRDLCHVDALITALGQYATVARGAAAWGGGADAGTAYMGRSAAYAVTNNSDPWETWTEFRQSAALLAATHALESGDASLAGAIYDAPTGPTASNLTLQFLAQVRYVSPSSGGLLNYTVCGGSWLCDPLVDWPTQTRDGFVLAHNPVDAVRNGLGASALQALADVAAQLGHAGDAASYAGMAAALRAGLVGRMLVADGPNGTAYFTDGAGVSHAAVHSSIYAVAGGALEALPSDAARASAAAGLTAFIRGKGPGSSSCMTARWGLEALYRLGVYHAPAAEAAAGWMASPAYPGWLDMAANGATVTLEAWAWGDKWNTDAGHPWCAGPAVILPRWTAGLQPTAPGWAAWRAAPQLAATGANLTALALRAPTPFGVVALNATAAEGGVSAVSVALPGGMPGLGAEGQVCLAAPTDTAVPPPAGDVLAVDGTPVADPVAWGRFLCTPPGATAAGAAFTVTRTPAAAAV